MIRKCGPGPRLEQPWTTQHASWQKKAGMSSETVFILIDLGRLHEFRPLWPYQCRAIFISERRGEKNKIRCICSGVTRSVKTAQITYRFVINSFYLTDWFSWKNKTNDHTAVPPLPSRILNWRNSSSADYKLREFSTSMKLYPDCCRTFWSWTKFLSSLIWILLEKADKSSAFNAIRRCCVEINIKRPLDTTRESE